MEARASVDEPFQCFRPDHIPFKCERTDLSLNLVIIPVLPRQKPPSRAAAQGCTLPFKKEH